MILKDLCPLGSVNGLTLTSYAYSVTYNVSCNLDGKVDGSRNLHSALNFFLVLLLLPKVQTYKKRLRLGTAEAVRLRNWKLKQQQRRSGSIY